MAARWFKMATRWFKMASSWPKVAPRWPKMAPRCFQKGAKVAQNGAKMPPKGAKVAENCIKKATSNSFNCRGLTACAADPGHAMQCHACKIQGNAIQCNTKRCSHAGPPIWLKDVECKFNAMQSNAITSPIMHLKLVPNWSASAHIGTKWHQAGPKLVPE